MLQTMEEPWKDPTAEDAFSAEYFQHLLASLTLNSRALIVELTSLAERFVDNAQEIVELIEERMMRILPKYKLYTFYLMDSIVKNIGSPYNLMFATNLYKLFTETYSIIDDTPTRQNLINLFKTWVCGKTSAGSDLFPKDTLVKVEKFIIQATSLGSSTQPDKVRITRDLILRESNYLLQYIISLEEVSEKVHDAKTVSPKAHDTLRAGRRLRHRLISDINLVSESAMIESKEEFESKKEQYVDRLREVRRVLDDQALSQQQMIKEAGPPPSLSSEQLAAPAIIQICPDPKFTDASSIFEKTLDHMFLVAIEKWGEIQEPINIVNDQIEQKEIPPALSPIAPQPAQSLASCLGLTFESTGFESSMPADDIHEPTLDSSGVSYEDDGDGYDPELTLNESDIRHSPPTSPMNGALIPGKSSLKRSIIGEQRTVKRVRFEV
ncbi:hypothetical protein OXX69_009472 [Metschnikowia pulcherrima]